ncbi:hypothetical protein E2C01_096581 [Portunus trituberculatus]|uniref:Uncharacterized protein n=1 Tax=Portunus trituberculatus TaxID=210409 RepID=A0A5B7K7L3_PORTR|nr:hypothetical protein [Portunus trituberculatus]
MKGSQVKSSQAKARGSKAGQGKVGQGKEWRHTHLLQRPNSCSSRGNEITSTWWSAKNSTLHKKQASHTCGFTFVIKLLKLIAAVRYSATLLYPVLLRRTDLESVMWRRTVC